MESRWYLQGYRDGWKNLARDYRVLNGWSRHLRNMTAEEAAEYDAGWKEGHSKIDGKRLEALGY